VPAVLIAEDWSLRHWNQPAATLVAAASGRRLQVGDSIGEALGCEHAGEQGEDCGRASACRRCPARTKSLEALAAGTQSTGVVLDIISPSGVRQGYQLSVGPIALADGPGVLMTIVEHQRDEQHVRDTVRRLRRLLGGCVEAITRAVEMGDPATAGHQRRVSDLARSIATELGLSARQVDAIRLAAMLHDIGKLAVPSDILTKPAALTPAQMALVRNHAPAGAEILAPIAYPEGLSSIVGQHHERGDGSGYPAGLRGDAICVEARILAVADVVEAMLSHRPYRPAHSLEAVLQELKQQRGRQLDARAVDACIRLFEDRGYRFPEDPR